MVSGKASSHLLYSSTVAEIWEKFYQKEMSKESKNRTYLFRHVEILKEIFIILNSYQKPNNDIINCFWRRTSGQVYVQNFYLDLFKRNVYLKSKRIKIKDLGSPMQINNIIEEYDWNDTSKNILFKFIPADVEMDFDYNITYKEKPYIKQADFDLIVDGFYLRKGENSFRFVTNTDIPDTDGFVINVNNKTYSYLISELKDYFSDILNPTKEEKMIYKLATDSDYDISEWIGYFK